MSGRTTRPANRRDDIHAFLPLPHLALHVLIALADADLHGWAIIKRIGQLTDGRTKPSSGSLYLSMVKLEERGLIREAPTPPSNDDSRRRYYRLTPLGRRVLEAETQRLSALIGRARALGVARGRGS